MHPAFDVLANCKNLDEAGQWRVRSAALTDSLEKFLQEMRLVDPGDLIAYARLTKYPNIADIVSSAAELSFAPGSLAFGWNANVNVRWDAPPLVMLDMEFRHKGVTAFFCMTFEKSDIKIVLQRAAFDGQHGDSDEATQAFVEALSNARFSSS
jgi:hypothetical protein